MAAIVQRLVHRFVVPIIRVRFPVAAQMQICLEESFVMGFFSSNQMIPYRELRTAIIWYAK